MHSFPSAGSASQPSDTVWITRDRRVLQCRFRVLSARDSEPFVECCVVCPPRVTSAVVIPPRQCRFISRPTTEHSRCALVETVCSVNGWAGSRLLMCVAGRPVRGLGTGRRHRDAVAAEVVPSVTTLYAVAVDVTR